MIFKKKIIWKKYSSVASKKYFSVDIKVLSVMTLKPLALYHHLTFKSANSLVTLGIGFNSLPCDFGKLLDFATKYLRKTVHFGVEIYNSVLDVRDVIAILLKICFSLITI